MRRWPFDGRRHPPKAWQGERSRCERNGKPRSARRSAAEVGASGDSRLFVGALSAQAGPRPPSKTSRPRGTLPDPAPSEDGAPASVRAPDSRSVGAQTPCAWESLARNPLPGAARAAIVVSGAIALCLSPHLRPTRQPAPRLARAPRLAPRRPGERALRPSREGARTFAPPEAVSRPEAPAEARATLCARVGSLLLTSTSVVRL